MRKTAAALFSAVILFASASGAWAAGKNQCIQCHEGFGGKLGAPVTEWKRSVHAKAGNECNICHGGNPDETDKKLAKDKKFDFAGRPDNKTITDFCGRGGCHQTALEQFKRGPHYQSVLKTGRPSCTTCHGVHDIQRSSRSIMTDSMCAAQGCHQAGYSRELVKTVYGIDDGLAALDKNVKYLKEKQGETAMLEKRIAATRHLFHQLVHVFSSEDMKTTKRIIDLEIVNLQNDIGGKVVLIKRLDMLFLIMVVFGLLIVVGVSSYTIFMYSRRRQ